jgi:hypothetical protein
MSIVLALPFTTRPPCLPPRPRAIPAEVADQLKRWTEGVLGPSTHPSIAVREWVSMDARTVPHWVAITRGATVLWIAKASERIVESDVRRAGLEAGSPRDRAEGLHGSGGALGVSLRA